MRLLIAAPAYLGLAIAGKSGPTESRMCQGANSNDYLPTATWHWDWAATKTSRSTSVTDANAGSGKASWFQCM